MSLPPPDDADELTWLRYEQDNVLTRGQAVSLLGRDRLDRLVRGGRWQVPVPGAVVAHNGPLTVSQRWWVAVLAAGADAVLAGLTAAIAGGLRRAGDGWIHVLVPAWRRPGRGRTGGAVVHRTTALTDKDVLRVGRPPRTTVARSLVDAAQWARDDDAARAIVAAGCQQRLVIAEELLEVVDRMPRAHRRGLVIDTARMSAVGATSLPEIDFARLCGRYRLPAPDRQAVRRDASGRRRFRDVYWRAWRVHVEIDGAWHTAAESWWADMRRQNDLWIAGDRVLRFPAWVVRARPDEVAAQVRAALVAAGWRGASAILDT